MFPETRFQRLKHETGTIVTFLYLGYLVYLLFQVINDKPLVQVSYEYLDKLKIPDIQVCGDWSDIEISRCVFTWDDSSSTTFDGCKDPFLRQTHINDNTYCYLYSNNDTYFYGNGDSNIKKPWVRGIDFYFKIKNVTAVTSHFISVGTITVQIMDPEYDPLWIKDDSKISTDARIMRELREISGFAGIQNVSTMVSFKKTTIRTIVPNDISSIFGLTPNYHCYPHLSTVSKDFPMHPNENFFDTGHFYIAPGSFIHEVRSEERSHTVIGALGSAGSAFGVIAVIYIVLFGRLGINSWAMMHRYAKLEAANNSDLNISETKDHEQRMAWLEDRVRELERQVRT